MNQSSVQKKAKYLSKNRKIKKVPFVELFNGRVQGVVSSGSDIKRVYVSFFEAGTFDYYCSTNNNRPCGGLRGSPCKHLRQLMSEAAAQYGADQVARFLKIPGNTSQIKTDRDIFPYLNGLREKRTGHMRCSAGFLSYLRYLELEPCNHLIPEMEWFV